MAQRAGTKTENRKEGKINSTLERLPLPSPAAAAAPHFLSHDTQSLALSLASVAGGWPRGTGDTVALPFAALARAAASCPNSHTLPAADLAGQLHWSKAHLQIWVRFLPSAPLHLGKDTSARTHIAHTHTPTMCLCMCGVKGSGEGSAWKAGRFPR